MCRPSCCNNSGGSGAGIAAVAIIMVAALVAAKIAISGADSAALVAAGIDAAERRVRQAVPIAEMIYLEPDIYRPGRVDATDPAIRAVRRPRR